jgi:hypothetical protein
MTKQPLHESEVESDTWYEGTDREIRGKGLSDVGGRAKVGVGLLELPPGSNTLPAHYHTREDEHLYVIEGELVLYLGIEVFELVAGRPKWTRWSPSSAQAAKRTRSPCAATSVTWRASSGSARGPRARGRCVPTRRT